MKLTGLLTMTIMLLASLQVDCQTVNFSCKDIPLKQVFTIIKKQTGTLFFYDEALIKEAKPVTIRLKNVPLEAALDSIFKDQPLDWVLEDKTVTISKKKPPNTNPPLSLPQSTPNQVAGIISDEEIRNPSYANNMRLVLGLQYFWSHSPELL
jgi:hypothetical protein